MWADSGQVTMAIRVLVALSLKGEKTGIVTGFQRRQFCGVGSLQRMCPVGDTTCQGHPGTSKYNQYYIAGLNRRSAKTG
jgi:hypothetical protein